MIMFRTRDIALVALMIGLAALTYKVKYEAQKQHSYIRQIERQIEATQDTINLLKAQWAQLSTPTRLSQLVEYYGQEIELEAIEPKQIVKLSEIPTRQPDAIDMLIAENIFDEAASFDLDMQQTGSVQP